MNVRLLTPEDTHQAKSLWQMAFDDPPAFVDWFFAHRYLPQWSAGVFDGEKLISAIHGMPMQLTGTDGYFSALMTSGVATLPQERGKGYMYAAMRYLQAYAQEQGIRALYQMLRQLYRRAGANEEYFALDSALFDAGLVNADMSATKVRYLRALDACDADAFPPISGETLTADYPGLGQSAAQVCHNTDERAKRHLETLL